MRFSTFRFLNVLFRSAGCLGFPICAIAAYGAFQMGKLPQALGFLTASVLIAVVWNRPRAVLDFGLPARHGKQLTFTGKTGEVLEKLGTLQASDSQAESWLRKAWAVGQLSQVTFAVTVVGALWRIYAHSLNSQPLLTFSPPETLYLGGGAALTASLWVLGGLLQGVFGSKDLHNGKLALLKGLVNHLGCDLSPRGRFRILAHLGMPRFRVHRVLRMFSMLGQPLVKEGYLDHWFTLNTVLADGTRLRVQVLARGKRTIRFKSKFKVKSNQQGFVKFGMPRASSRILLRIQPPAGQSYQKRELERVLGEPKGFLRSSVRKLEVEPGSLKLDLRQGGALELEQVLAPLVWVFRGLARLQS